MQKKKFIRTALASVLLWIVITPLGGYGGHHIKFIAASLLYCAVLYYFLTKTDNKRERVYTLIIFLVPPTVTIVPIHILLFESSLLSLPSSLAHYLGISAGLLLFYLSKRMKVVTFLLLTAFSLWVTFYGYSFWLHKINFGTFSGRITKEMPVHSISGINQSGAEISYPDLQNKTLILDFWFTQCGVCFKEFPRFQKLYSKYSSDTSLVFLAINKPIKQDSAGEAFNVIKEEGYDFRVLLPLLDKLPEMFNVQFYPTCIIIDRNGKAQYFGEIDGAEVVLKELMKEVR